MKRKLEDQLVQMAFGDMTPEDAARLTQLAQSDPNAARALESYRQIRNGLHSLREVPEPQLSNERLRDAILRSGLPAGSGEPIARRWTWAWVPVGALALAFSLTMMRGGGEAAPMIVEDTAGSSRERSVVALNAPLAKTEGILPSRLDAAPVVRPPQADRAVASAPQTRTPRRQSRLASRTERSKPDVPVRPSLLEPPPVTMSTLAVGPMSGAFGAPSTPASDEGTVILILPQKDDATGAQIATEVQNRSDVLIGG